MCEICCVRMFCLAKYATKAWRPTANTLSKRAKKSVAGANDNEDCSAVVLSSAPSCRQATIFNCKGTSFASASIFASGNKATMANHLYQHFHTSDNHVSTNPMAAIRHCRPRN